PSSVNDPDQAQQFLSQRLRRAQDLSGLQKLLQDPEVQKLARDVALDPGKYGLTKERLEELKRKGLGSKPDLNDPNWREPVDQAVQAEDAKDDRRVSSEPE